MTCKNFRKVKSLTDLKVPPPFNYTCAAVLAVVAEDGVVADLDGIFEVDGVLKDNLELARKRKPFFLLQHSSVKTILRHLARILVVQLVVITYT